MKKKSKRAAKPRMSATALGRALKVERVESGQLRHRLHMADAERVALFAQLSRLEAIVGRIRSDSEMVTELTRTLPGRHQGPSPMTGLMLVERS